PPAAAATREAQVLLQAPELAAGLDADAARGEPGEGGGLRVLAAGVQVEERPGDQRRHVRGGRERLPARPKEEAAGLEGARLARVAMEADGEATAGVVLAVDGRVAEEDHGARGPENAERGRWPGRHQRRQLHALELPQEVFAARVEAAGIGAGGFTQRRRQ